VLLVRQPADGDTAGVQGVERLRIARIIGEGTACVAEPHELDSEKLLLLLLGRLRLGAAVLCCALGGVLCGGSDDWKCQKRQ